MRGMHAARRRFVVALAAAAFAGCASIPETPLARYGSEPAARALPCPPGESDPRAGSIDPARPLSVLSWNIHKNATPGFGADLQRLAASSDLVLLQETVMDAGLSAELDHASLHWVQAEAWSTPRGAAGVLVASRVRPLSACMLRVAEPVIVVPKTTMIAWYRVAGREAPLAVASLHAINFTLGMVAYRHQVEALAAALATHRGPIVIGGDFNTWSPVREQLLDETFARAGLVQVLPRRGERSRFLGLPVDYLFVRGLSPIDAHVPPITTSDHAPIVATLGFDP